MSNEEQQQQAHFFKKIDQYGVRITAMQGVTIIALLFSGFTWVNSKDQKQAIDGAALYVKIDNLGKDFRISKTRDSLILAQHHLVDSITLDARIVKLKTDINEDMSRKFFFTNERLDRLEKRVNLKFVQEIKSNGQISIKPVNN